MAINGYFFNAIRNGDEYDRTYSAEDFTSYLKLLIGNGVFPNPSTNLQVLANTGMSILVKAGSGWIDGHKIENTADLILPISAADTALNRIDGIIFACDYANREMKIYVKEGVEGVQAVAPTLIRNNDLYEMCLAYIYVGKQVTSISQTSITDKRGDSNVCGWVQGLINQVDTSTLVNQWQQAYEEGIVTNQAEFDNWFSSVRENLATTTLMRQYTSSVATVAGQTVVPINISQYNQNLDILNVFINGLKFVDGVDYIINDNTSITLAQAVSVNQTIEFEVFKSVDGSEAETVVTQVHDLQVEVNTINDRIHVYSEEKTFNAGTSNYNYTLPAEYVKGNFVILNAYVENNLSVDVLTSAGGTETSDVNLIQYSMILTSSFNFSVRVKVNNPTTGNLTRKIVFVLMKIDEPLAI